MNLKSSLLVTSLLWSAFSFGNGNWTNEKVMKLDFSKTNIQADKIKISYTLICSYQKKFLDIIEGRIGVRDVSCGKNVVELKVNEKSELILPAVPEFNKLKGDNKDNYSLNLKMEYEGKILFWVATFKENGISDFYKNDFNLNFRQFEIKNMELLYQGLNIVNSPDFDSEKAEVTIEFHSPLDQRDRRVVDTNYDIWFRVYSRNLKNLREQNILDNNGKIHLGPSYTAFINNEGEDKTLSVSIAVKNKEGKYVMPAAPKAIPFTQEAIDQFQSVDLTEFAEY